jgi:hypothetical protein
LATLRYYRGLLTSDVPAPGLRYDQRLGLYVGLPYRYREVLEYLR